MNSHVKTFLIFAVFLFTSVLLGSTIAYGFQFFSCKAAAQSLNHIPAIKPARFLVYGSSPGTVSCHFSLYNRNSKEIASIERSWNGGALYVDFLAVRFDDRVLYFPVRLYSDYSEEGVQLKRYYLFDDICSIYSVYGEDPEEIKKIKKLCTFAFSAYKLPFYKKYITVKTVRLTSMPMGHISAIYISNDGRIMLLPD